MIEYDDENGNKKVLAQEFEDLWLKTFKLESIDEIYIPKHNDEIKHAMQNKEIRLTKGSLQKLAQKNRLQYISQIKQVLDEPEIILRDIDNIMILAKRIDNELFLTSVNLETKDYFISISNAPKKEKVLINKVKNGAKVLYQSPNAKSIFYTETLLHSGKSPLNEIDKRNTTKKNIKSQAKSKSSKNKSNESNGIGL